MAKITKIYSAYKDLVKTASLNPNKLFEEKTNSTTWMRSKLQGLKDYFKGSKGRGGKRGGKAELPEKLEELKLQYRDKVQVGEFVMFAYDPKLKNDLPFYDKFPLVMVIGPAKGGFYGLNFHYLPLKQRAQFFDAYLAFGKKNRRTPWQRRLIVTYQMLKSIAKLKYYKPCFKHYLFNYVRSPYSVVKKEEWRAALFLPTARWEKGSQKAIWADSLSKIQ